MTVRLAPYFVMNGNAKEAIQFYGKTLGAQVLFQQSFGDMKDPNMPVPDAAKDRVLHAMIKIGESDLMLSDTFPGQDVQSGGQVTICIMSSDAEQTRKFYEALQDGGKVNMPLQETFFSPAYGIVEDKFGITFQLFTDKPM